MPCSCISVINESENCKCDPCSIRRCEISSKGTAGTHMGQWTTQGINYLSKKTTVQNLNKHKIRVTFCNANMMTNVTSKSCALVIISLNHTL